MTLRPSLLRRLVSPAVTALLLAGCGAPMPGDGQGEVGSIESAATVLCSGPGFAQNLAAGPILSVPQSYNETRGIIVTPTTSSIAVTSMTLNGLVLALPGGLVGARIYDATTHVLIATNTVTGVGPGTGLSITVPISTVLNVGTSYVASFYVHDGTSGGSAYVTQPTSLPYTAGPFTVTGLRDGAPDAYPPFTNIFAPQITIKGCPTAPVVFNCGTTPSSASLSPAGAPIPLVPWNETRGLEFVPTAPFTTVNGLTLNGLNLSVAGATVGARIYNTSSGTLVGSGTVTVAGTGSGLTITIPVYTSLAGGSSYVAAFYVVGGAGTATHVNAPPFPYTVGSYTVLAVRDIAPDAFPPVAPSPGVPQISIITCP